MSEEATRIGNLPREEWTDEARDIFAFFGEETLRETGGKNLTMVLANHPPLGIAYLTFGKHLLLNSTVPVRPRELIVLRVGYVQKCAYEWHFHVGYALTAGMTMEEIGAVRDGWNSPVWDGKDEDRAVLRAVDELIGNSCVSDETWAQLSRFFNRQQLMDLVFTVGNYVMVAWAGRTFGIPVEENEDEIGFDLKTRSGNPRGASHRPSEEARGDPMDDVVRPRRDPAEL
jgi:4-carboxymuconolactone decarboxylase